ncbi:ATPase [Planobispora rosea]|uniref:ATPase n=1 Tax=Planobispora rosea TaxID=35762 RepID=A0A8J3S5U3_PLARO|nr:AAA family ATPase [Planobispora rosea]GGS85080.1 ATPase [Planobispora rosea]GIH86472.1 ATPase [Planobispora rosea]
MTLTAPLTTAPPSADPGDGSGTAARLRAIIGEVGARYLERAEVVHALVACLLAGQHSLLLGPPGTAKSELARELTGRITGARFWEILLSTYTDPKAIFGPIDVAALMQGSYQQIWDGRATQADIAFIDEIFKCGPGALNAMLAFLNERLYHPEAGGAPIPCPLLAAITASNELPSGEDSAAVYDRLLVRIQVGYLAEVSNFAHLMRSATLPAVPAVPAAPPTTVTLADLQAAVRIHVPAITIPETVVEAVCTLRAALHRAEIIASDRRWRLAMRLLQACAFLAGRRQVDISDLAILTHVLWNSPAERPTTQKQVLKIVNPDAGEALDLLKAIEELNTELDGKLGRSREELSEWAAREANPKLARAGHRLEELHQQSQAAGRSTAALDEVITRYRAVHTRLMTEALGISSRMASTVV